MFGLGLVLVGLVAAEGKIARSRWNAGDDFDDGIDLTTGGALVADLVTSYQTHSGMPFRNVSIGLHLGFPPVRVNPGRTGTLAACA